MAYSQFSPVLLAVLIASATTVWFLFASRPAVGVLTFRNAKYLWETFVVMAFFVVKWCLVPHSWFLFQSPDAVASLLTFVLLGLLAPAFTVLGFFAYFSPVRWQCFSALRELARADERPRPTDGTRSPCPPASV